MSAKETTPAAHFAAEEVRAQWPTVHAWANGRDVNVPDLVRELLAAAEHFGAGKLWRDGGER